VENQRTLHGFMMARNSVQTRSALPDLDSADRIEDFVHRFYRRLLADPVMAPLFRDVAGVDLQEHLPLIVAYWRKMLLGEAGYQRHTMERHRVLDSKHPLTEDHARRWLQYFNSTLDEGFRGPYAERARHIAARVMDNLMAQLAARRGNRG
jgi:hemoglobin